MNSPGEGHRNSISETCKNKLLPKKTCANVLLLFTLLNFNEIGYKQCNENGVPYFLYNSHGNAIKSAVAK